jgi:hypothetical protein
VTIECLTCRERFISSNNSVGDAMKETGCKPILCADGDMKWLCKDHAEMIGRDVQELVRALGGNADERLRYLYWPSLLKIGGVL